MSVHKMNFRSVKIVAALAFVVMLLVAVVLYTQSAFDLNQQMALGWGSLAVLYLMSKSPIFNRQPWRTIFITMAFFIGIRYFAWRIEDTLIYTGFVDFVGLALLFLAEVYGFTLFLLDMFVNFSSLNTPIRPLPANPDSYPTVDVFIPTYDEPDHILRMTVIAASQINYPKHKYNVYILDDGGTQEKRSNPKTSAEAWARHYRLKKLASECGVQYITRETNQNAKAGNINHALEHTDSDLILVLDCDQIPTKDILRNTVGQFLFDPKLFLVQTPHFFINQTPINSNLVGVETKPDESEMFYRRVQPSMNFWNASFFCGSTAVLRRKYLMEVGGISTRTITEDAETSLVLHSKGYNSCYINRPMVCGLSPESHADYLTQQSRWAKGMVQILMDYSPLFRKGLSVPQRLTYFSTCFGWLFGFSRYIFFLAPSAFLLFNLNIYPAKFDQMFDFTIPYVLSIFIVIGYFFAGSRQMMFSEIYETVRGFRLLKAMLPVLLNTGTHKFVVTPKGTNIEKDYLSEDAFPLFLLLIINVLSVYIGLTRWAVDNLHHENIAITTIWCLFNTWLGLMALGAFNGKKQIRSFHRIETDGNILAYFHSAGINKLGELLDISASGIGFRIQLDTPPKDGEIVNLQVRDSYGNDYSFRAVIPHAREENGFFICGAQFLPEVALSPEVIGYVYGDSERWTKMWESSVQERASYYQLTHFTKLGYKLFFTNLDRYLIALKDEVIGFIKKIIKPSFWIRLVSTLTSWLVYCFYLLVVSINGMVDQNKARKFPRLYRDDRITVYFPRIDAYLSGHTIDNSLTGIGIKVKLPFNIIDRENVVVSRVDENGQSYQLKCVIRKVIEKSDGAILGAEFVVDFGSYMDVVHFVYGKSSTMIYSLTLGNAKNILAGLFLQPKPASANRNLTN